MLRVRTCPREAAIGLIREAGLFSKYRTSPEPRKSLEGVARRYNVLEYTAMTSARVFAISACLASLCLSACHREKTEATVLCRTLQQQSNLVDQINAKEAVLLASITTWASKTVDGSAPDRDGGSSLLKQMREVEDSMFRLSASVQDVYLTTPYLQAVRDDVTTDLGMRQTFIKSLEGPIQQTAYDFSVNILAIRNTIQTYTPPANKVKQNLNEVRAKYALLDSDIM
jgi:hypothetical protein